MTMDFLMDKTFIPSTIKSSTNHTPAKVMKTMFLQQYQLPDSIFAISEFFYVCLPVYKQIFNFRDGHVTTFRHPSGPISAKCLVTDSPD